MLVFHGGLTFEEVKRLENNEDIVFSKVPINKINISRCNTFDYYPKDMIFDNYIEMNQYISDDIFMNQYIFLFKYLRNAYDFCEPYEERDYILVADLDEEILNEYIGVGKYFINSLKRIEYRLPRKFIKKENIVDFLYYDILDIEQLKIYQDRFRDFYFSESEEINANKLILKKSLVFNGDKY